MIKKLLKEHIKKAIESNSSFSKFIRYNFQPTSNIEDILATEIDNYLISKDQTYQFSNFKRLFYEDILSFDPHRFANFLRNIINDDPKREKTFQHILNDIEGKLQESYNIPNSYIKMKRSELDQICEDLLLKEDYVGLINTRKFIKDNFRVFDYNSYLKENRDLAIKILKSKGQDETDKTYARLRTLLKNHTGYLGIFTYFNKIEKVPFITLSRLYARVHKDHDILNMLPEPLIDYMRHRLPYKAHDGRTYNKHFERLTDDLTNIEDKHKAKLFADDFPVLLRMGLSENSDFIEIIKDLTNDKEKLDMYNLFFIKKVARYKTQKELMDALMGFVYVTNDDENIRNIINQHNMANLVYDDGELIVARTRNQDAMQQIASDTSWCIKDSLSYWTQYVKEDNVQLVIIDLTEKKASLNRKIGVTLEPGWGGSDYDFNTAHLKNDSYISEIQLAERLKKHDIDLKDLFKIAKSFGSNEYYAEEDVSSEEYRR